LRRLAKIQNKKKKGESETPVRGRAIYCEFFILSQRFTNKTNKNKAVVYMVYMVYLVYLVYFFKKGRKSRHALYL